MKTSKEKRKRITLPTYTQSVYRRIKEKKAELGILMTTTEDRWNDKWNSICNEVKMMNLSY